jgi:hypothetical protein
VLGLRDEQAETAGVDGDVEFPCGGSLALPAWILNRWRRRRFGGGLVSRVGRGSRRRRKRTWELWAGGGVHGLGGREAFEVPESVEGLDKFLGVGEDGDGVGLGAGAGSLAGFPVGRQRGGRDRGVFL